jgi:hypothetical protein
MEDNNYNHTNTVALLSLCASLEANVHVCPSLVQNHVQNHNNDVLDGCVTRFSNLSLYKEINVAQTYGHSSAFSVA